MSDFTPKSGIRDRFFTPSGDNADEGTSTTFAKKTLNDSGLLDSEKGGLSAVMELNPQLFNPATLINQGAGPIAECFVIPDNVQVRMPSSAVQSDGSLTTVVSAGANAQLTSLTISTSDAAGETAYSTNGKSRVSLDSRAVILNGPNQTGCSIDGATDQAFQNVGQILTRFDDSTGVDITSTGNEPRYFQYNEVNISGDNSDGIHCDTPATGVAAFRVGAITYEDNPLTPSTGAGSAAIRVDKGFMAGYTIEIEMEGAVVVEADGDLILDNLLGVGNVTNNGKLNLTSRRLTGDINNSGFLTIRVDEHVSGSIINSGILNGEINGIRYGSWVDEDTGEQGRVFNRSGNVSPSSQVLGYLTLDTNTDTIDSIVGSYFQSTFATRQYDLEVVDADTLAVYYSASNSVGGFGPHSFDAKIGAGLPVASVVNLVVLQSRTGGGGLSDGQCTIEFTRVS